MVDLNEAVAEFTKPELRQIWINDGQMAKRLLENPDFKRFCELLEMDKQGLLRTLLNEEATLFDPKRLKARINQIDRVIKKPKSLIWRMENMTEVKDAKEEQARAKKLAESKNPS